MSIQNNINIPKIIEYQTEDKYIYTVETYIQGITLFEYLSKIHIENKKISDDYFNNFLEQTVKILYKLHDQGIIHRDIKPENIIIAHSDEIFLIDFDISRVYNQKKT